MKHGKNKSDSGVGLKEKIAIVLLLMAMSINSPNPSGKHSVHLANKQEETQVESRLTEDLEVDIVVMNK